MEQRVCQKIQEKFTDLIHLSPDFFVSRPNITDVIRAMFALGFSPEEIYEILSMAGLPWEDAQLLIERLKNESEKFVGREDRLLKAVEEVVRQNHSELIEKLSSMEMKIDFIIRSLRNRKAREK
ncbi:MAG: hypothetical protein QXF11_03015 [Candidatus Hadarchaeales archaeon]